MLRIVLLALAVGCAGPTARSTERSWCEEPLSKHDDWTLASDFQVLHVPARVLPLALERLATRRVIPLNSKEVQQYTGLNNDRTGKYYLVRSGIQGQADLDSDRLVEDVSRGHFRFYYSLSARILSISTFQVGRGESQLYNLPIVIRAERTVDDVVTRCFRMS